jgi:spermidine synthase
VLLAVRREFPFVRAFLSLDGWGLHISASREPFELPTPAAFAARLPEKAARDLVEWSPGQTPERMIGILLGNEISIDGVLAAGPAVSLTDDRPVNEYFLLRRLLNGKIVSGLSPMAR